MSNDFNHVEDLIQKLGATVSIDNCLLLFDQFARSRGFDYTGFVVISIAEPLDEMVARMGTIPGGAYLENMAMERVEQNTFYGRLRASVLPQAISNDDAELAGPEFKELREAHARYDIQSGYGVGIPGEGPIRRIVVLASRRLLSPAEAERLRGDATLFAACLYFARRMRELMAAENPAFVKLTPQERRCLNWASQGKTSWEIGQIIGIAERTVVFHLENAKAKLGVRSRQQAVATAARLGII
jgi:DNA-binding CsgD family transcriptional regulator